MPVHMMTARKRVGLLPTHRLAVRHLVDYSSSDQFSSNDSSRDSSADALSDSTCSRSSSDHSLPHHHWVAVRVVVEAIDREEIETGMRGLRSRLRHWDGYLVQRFHDHTKEILVRHVQVIESVQRDQGYRILAKGQ
ncbi:hypothetical protein Tco_0344326 [Tanacetum coccineum]